MNAQPASIYLAAFMSEHLERDGLEPDLLRSMMSTFVRALMGTEVRKRRQTSTAERATSTA